MPNHLPHPDTETVRAAAPMAATSDGVEARPWRHEHDRRCALWQRAVEVAPILRCPDLLNACVSLVSRRDDAARGIGHVPGTALVPDGPTTPRRHGSVRWRPYALPHDLQGAPSHRPPRPRLHQDQLTTACLASCQQDDVSGSVVVQTRHDMVEHAQAAQRASIGAEARPDLHPIRPGVCCAAHPHPP